MKAPRARAPTRSIRQAGWRGVALCEANGSKGAPVARTAGAPVKGMAATGRLWTTAARSMNRCALCDVRLRVIGPLPPKRNGSRALESPSGSMMNQNWAKRTVLPLHSNRGFATGWFSPSWTCGRRERQIQGSVAKAARFNATGFMARRPDWQQEIACDHRTVLIRLPAVGKRKPDCPTIARSTI